MAAKDKGGNREEADGDEIEVVVGGQVRCMTLHNYKREPPRQGKKNPSNFSIFNFPEKMCILRLVTLNLLVSWPERTDTQFFLDHEREGSLLLIS